MPLSRKDEELLDSAKFMGWKFRFEQGPWWDYDTGIRYDGRWVAYRESGKTVSGHTLMSAVRRVV